MSSASQAFRNKQHVLNLSTSINALADEMSATLQRPLRVMEICGGHTHAIYRFGIDQLLSKDIQFVHGPGCPVCVLPPEAIDEAIAIATPTNRILLSFGDALKVSGSQTNLLYAKAEGVDVRIVYAPFDALQIAKDNPDKQVVFFAIGFDTTMPGIAHTIAQAKKAALNNLYFLIYHIQLIPTLQALFSQEDYPALDGLIGPGHVSMVIGEEAYRPIAETFNIPLVIGGFEPVEILQALYQVLTQVKALQDKEVQNKRQRAKVENAYQHVVLPEGNTIAKTLLAEVFEPDNAAHWRGLGRVPYSGVKLRSEYACMDAKQFLADTNSRPDSKDSKLDEPEFCQQVLTGRIRPTECPFFKTECHPETPKGALMVSSEGACSAYFQYKQDVQGAE